MVSKFGGKPTFEEDFLEGLFCDRQGLRMRHAKSNLSLHGHDFHRGSGAGSGERNREWYRAPSLLHLRKR